MILIGIIIVLAIAYAVLYNGIVRSNQKVKEGWSGIDVQLKRRLDLIPNLLASVKGYAAHEKDLIEKVTQQRTAALAIPADDTGKRIEAEKGLSASLRSVFAVAENYPDLKANTTFLDLQRQLGETEDQISAARRIYNANVTDYNQAIATFPGNVIAGMHHFTPSPFFTMDADEQKQAAKAPVVSF